MEELKLTELEAIHYCIDKGIKGSEKRLKTFQRLGRLDGEASINSLMADLGTLAETVEREKNQKGEFLKGKNRIYNLKNPKSKIEKRQKGYMGMQLAKTEDEILKEYVFNELLKLKYQKSNFGNTHSLTVWAKIIKLIDIENIDRELSRELFSNIYSVKESGRVTTSIVERLKDRNRDTVDLAFKHLEKEKRISRLELYYKKQGDNSVNIEKNEFEEISEAIRKKAAKHGMEYKKYVGAKRTPQKVSDEDKKIIALVDKMLMKKFDISGVFKMLRIDILNEDERQHIAREQMEKAMIDKTVILSRHNHKKKIKKNNPPTGFVEKEFIFYNMLYFLQEVMNIKGLEDEMDNNSPTTKEIEYVQSIIREYAEQRSREESLMVGFGENRRKPIAN